MRARGKNACSLHVPVVITISVISIQTILLFFPTIRTVSSSLCPDSEPRAQKDQADLIQHASDVSRARKHLCSLWPTSAHHPKGDILSSIFPSGWQSPWWSLLTSYPSRGIKEGIALESLIKQGTLLVPCLWQQTKKNWLNLMLSWKWFLVGGVWTH